MPCLKFRDVLRILENNGFTHIRTKGSHARYDRVAHGKTWNVTLQIGKMNDDVAAGTLGSIIRQSGLDKKLFR
jgi:predicted RNA binding protein YcfA (HicA-like mRNA interferase family)